MEGLTIQPGNLNILVASLGKELANLTVGRIYQALVLEQVGTEKFLLQVGGNQVLAENQANLQVGELLKLLVKEAAPGKLILQRVNPAPDTEADKFVGSGGDLKGSSTKENPSFVFPLAITWQNQPLQGELRLWHWEGEQGARESGGGDKIWRALLQVHSSTLGEIKADILLCKRDVQVLFRSQSKETQNFIVENLAVLRQTLEAAGLQVKKLVHRAGPEEAGEQRSLERLSLDLRV